MDIVICENKKKKLCVEMVIKDIGSFTFYGLLLCVPPLPFSLFNLSEMSRRIFLPPNSQCYNAYFLPPFVEARRPEAA
jgi:hypothetical protein